MRKLLKWIYDLGYEHGYHEAVGDITKWGLPVGSKPGEPTNKKGE